MVRAIAVAILLCLSATSAFSYRAVSVSPSGSRLWYSPEDRKTAQEAIRDSLAGCKSISGPSDRCRVVAVFKNRCLGVTKAVPSFVAPAPDTREYFWSTAATISEAQSNADLLCSSTYDISQCVPFVRFCDTTDVSTDECLFDFLSAWLPKKYGPIQSWWKSDVTTSALIVVGAFVILAAALVYTMLQIRRLRRLLADHAEPLRSMTSKAPHTQPGTSEPMLDTKAIKEAIKHDAKRREEFEI